MSLTIEPDFSLEWSRDVFGNSVAVVDFLEEAKDLRIIPSALRQSQGVSMGTTADYI